MGTAGILSGAELDENRPAIAVAEREWEEIASWLRNEQVWQHSDKFDVEEIESALARWKEHEMLLILPHNYWTLTLT